MFNKFRSFQFMYSRKIGQIMQFAVRNIARFTDFSLAFAMFIISRHEARKARSSFRLYSIETLYNVLRERILRNLYIVIFSYFFLLKYPNITNFTSVFLVYL